MPIASTDIDFHLSGGSGNSDPDAALGGAISTTQITGATLGNLFDTVGSDEANDGDVEYRCFYVKNNHGSLTLQNTVIYISSNTSSADTTAAIGAGTSSIGGTEQTIANESTAPTSVTFSSPATKATGISLGNIPAGSHKAVWIRRTVSAGASAAAEDALTLKVEGDTAA